MGYGGRPTLYSPQMLEKAREYLESAYLDNGKVIPSHVGLALYLGVSRQTLDNWADNPDNYQFFDILESIQAKQQELLLNNGLNGTFNSAITKLALGKHGYHDKVDNQISGEIQQVTRRIVDP